MICSQEQKPSANGANRSRHRAVGDNNRVNFKEGEIKQWLQQSQPLLIIVMANYEQFPVTFPSKAIIDVCLVAELR